MFTQRAIPCDQLLEHQGAKTDSSPTSYAAAGFAPPRRFLLVHHPCEAFTRVAQSVARRAPPCPAPFELRPEKVQVQGAAVFRFLFAVAPPPDRAATSSLLTFPGGPRLEGNPEIELFAQRDGEADLRGVVSSYCGWGGACC
jgi:hypothetical protein